jgi:hypothetical protein
MLGTNAELRNLLLCVDREMQQREIEILCADEIDSAVAARLRELRDVRRLLVRVLLNRRQEAAKPVVDFALWLHGSGALYDRPLTQYRPENAAQPSP